MTAVRDAAAAAVSWGGRLGNGASGGPSPLDDLLAYLRANQARQQATAAQAQDAQAGEGDESEGGDDGEAAGSLGGGGAVSGIHGMLSGEEEEVDAAEVNCAIAGITCVIMLSTGTTAPHTGGGLLNLAPFTKMRSARWGGFWFHHFFGLQLASPNSLPEAP